MRRRDFSFTDGSAELCTDLLIGLKAVHKAVEEIVSVEYLYRLEARHPQPFMIPLDKGEGRTAVSRYITEQFKTAHILRFEDCLEDLLEHEMDGTIQQMYMVFGDIAMSADYANERHGVDTFDLTSIAYYEDDYLKDQFIKRVTELCRTAGVIFFISEVPAPREEALIARLRKAVPGIRRFAYEAYSHKDLVSIAVKTILDKGIVIPEQKVIEKELSSAFAKKDVALVKQAISIADEMIGMCTRVGEQLYLKTDALQKRSVSKVMKTENSSISDRRRFG